MTRTRHTSLLHKGLLPIALVVLAAGTGCGGSSPAATTAAATAATSTGTGTSTGTATVTAPSAGTPTTPPAASIAPVTAGKATGGGDFCKLVAAAADRAAVSGASADDIAARIATVRKDEATALLLAPSAIKADVTLLYAAADKVWVALESVHYDYSKLKAGDVSALATPDVAAAEKRLTAYMSDTCGLRLGAPASSGGK